MRLALQSSFSPLVSTDFGVGFWDERTRTLRKSHAVHVAPEPREIRPATAEEARDFFRARAFHRAELTRHYDRADRLSISIGD
jgi:hypothetical protein